MNVAALLVAMVDSVLMGQDVSPVSVPPGSLTLSVAPTSMIVPAVRAGMGQPVSIGSEDTYASVSQVQSEPLMINLNIVHLCQFI